MAVTKTFVMSGKTFNTTQHLHERMEARVISAREVGDTILNGQWVYQGKNERGNDSYRIARDFDNYYTTNYVVVAVERDGTYSVLTTFHRGRRDNGV
jgi:hypothetical protein